MLNKITVKLKPEKILFSQEFNSFNVTMKGRMQLNHDTFIYRFSRILKN
jgi:hypothetical protein